MMSSARRMPPTRKNKPKEEVNKKALIWIGSILGAIVVIMAALLILS